ncbi:hypothetical protein BDFB_013475 [Asbolus verrucosus]|uniref:Uncharacterized protein n=1 Tax=Asbolus verrucosus TaxID=1661398 RepID=A0A482W3E3_ASBVE|nr:hypothetical protein BDFB_013475 [Asbolus verrucosus]
MGPSLVLVSLLFLQTLTGGLGEPSYYQQNRLFGYPYYTNSYTYYTNPFRQYHKYYDSPITHDDDRIYITDKYGRTTVSSARTHRGFY